MCLLHLSNVLLSNENHIYIDMTLCFALPSCSSDIVSQEMKVWDASKMWPFSCFTYSKDGQCISGKYFAKPIINSIYLVLPVKMVRAVHTALNQHKFVSHSIIDEI